MLACVVYMGCVLVKANHRSKALLTFVVFILVYAFIFVSVLSDVEPEVPSSLSHVLLRVGSTLKLQCRQGAFWERNGVRLRNGDKFTIGSDALIIKNTGTVLLHQGEMFVYLFIL